MNMKKTILNIAAAATLAASFNPAFANTEVIGCNLYPVHRYANEGPTVKETAIACTARYANVRPSQVRVIAVDIEHDKVLVSVVFRTSTKTFLLIDQEPML
jgi:hypothetical protein